MPTLIVLRRRYPFSSKAVELQIRDSLCGKRTQNTYPREGSVVGDFEFDLVCGFCRWWVLPFKSSRRFPVVNGSKKSNHIKVQRMCRCRRPSVEVIAVFASTATPVFSFATTFRRNKSDFFARQKKNKGPIENRKTSQGESFGPICSVFAFADLVFYTNQTTTSTKASQLQFATMSAIFRTRPFAQAASLRNGTRLCLTALSANRHILYSYSSSASRRDRVPSGTTDAALKTASSLDGDSKSQGKSSDLKWYIPQRTREKVISAQDAVALVRNGDTVAISGFVCQGSPEGLLKALGERFQETQEPKDLTLFFGGGPGDYGERGLSHLARVSEDGKTKMLKRTIGG